MLSIARGFEVQFGGMKQHTIAQAGQIAQLVHISSCGGRSSAIAYSRIFQRRPDGPSESERRSGVIQVVRSKTNIDLREKIDQNSISHDSDLFRVDPPLHRQLARLPRVKWVQLRQRAFCRKEAKLPVQMFWLAKASWAKDSKRATRRAQLVEPGEE
jgi:hypothetical protein